jgi:hypothetical protein
MGVAKQSNKSYSISISISFAILMNQKLKNSLIFAKELPEIILKNG